MKKIYIVCSVALILFCLVASAVVLLPHSANADPGFNGCFCLACPPLYCYCPCPPYFCTCGAQE